MTFDFFQRQIQERFGRGESLRVGNGASLNPVIADRLDPITAQVTDCISDDTWWITTSTGEALPSEPASLHTSYTKAMIFKNSGGWVVSNASNRSGPCGG